MTGKLADIQSALNRTRGGAGTTDPEPAAVKTPVMRRPAGVAAPSRQANRTDRVNVSAWLDPGFKASLRMVQAKRPGSIQELMEEALNDLFAKYNVPPIHQ